MNTKFRVLIVDDNEDMLELISRRFSNAGFAVETVTSGNAAVNLATQSRFDVILSDIHMPDGTGVDLVKKLVSSGFNGPVFFLTGDVTFSREIAINLGVREIFRKPLDFPAVLSAVKLSLKTA